MVSSTAYRRPRLGAPPSGLFPAEGGVGTWPFARPDGWRYRASIGAASEDSARE